MKKQELQEQEAQSTEISTVVEKKNLFNLLQTATGLKDAVNIRIVIMLRDILQKMESLMRLLLITFIKLQIYIIKL